MPKSVSSNKSGGKDNDTHKKLEKAATSGKGKIKQPKGSAESGAKARYSKPMKTPSSGKQSMDEMEF